MKIRYKLMKQPAPLPAMQPTGIPEQFSSISATTEQLSNPGQTVGGQPPVVIKTHPASGARDILPGLTEIRVTFSKDMTDGSWSWTTAWPNSMPPIIGQPHYEPDHRTAVIKVNLEPGRTYGYWLNSERYHSFTDQSGHPAVPYLLIFQTRQPATTTE